MQTSGWLRRGAGWGLYAVVLFACLLVLSAGSAFAQLSSATLNGTVRDASGAVIANASVTLRNVDTTVERKTTYQRHRQLRVH